MQSLRFDIWKSVENGYNTPKINLDGTTDRILYEYNAKERNAIPCDVAIVEFTKVMQCTLAKDIELIVWGMTLL